jgi:hypothetical protein
MTKAEKKGGFSRIERMIASALTGICLGVPSAYLAATVYTDLDAQIKEARHQGIYVQHVDLRPIKIRNLKRPFKIKLAKKLKIDRVDTSLIVVDAYKRLTSASADRIPTNRTNRRGLKPRDPYGTENLSKSEQYTEQ